MYFHLPAMVAKYFLSTVTILYRFYVLKTDTFSDTFSPIIYARTNRQRVSARLKRDQNASSAFAKVFSLIQM